MVSPDPDLRTLAIFAIGCRHLEMWGESPDAAGKSQLTDYADAVLAAVLPAHRAMVLAEAAAQRGICGATVPGAFPYGAPLLCSLPAGHLGWHHTSDGADFSPPLADATAGQQASPIPSTATLPAQNGPEVSEAGRGVAEAQRPAEPAESAGWRIIQYQSPDGLRWKEHADGWALSPRGQSKAYSLAEIEAECGPLTPTGVDNQAALLAAHATQTQLAAYWQARAESAEAELTQMTRDRDAVRAERDRLADTIRLYEPVVDAAQAWGKTEDPPRGIPDASNAWIISLGALSGAVAALGDAAAQPNPEPAKTYEDGIREGWYNAGLSVREDQAAIRAYAKEAGFANLADGQAAFVGRIVCRIRMGLQYAAQDGSLDDLTALALEDPDAAGTGEAQPETDAPPGACGYCTGVFLAGDKIVHAAGRRYHAEHFPGTETGEPQ